MAGKSLRGKPRLNNPSTEPNGDVLPERVDVRRKTLPRPAKGNTQQQGLQVENGAAETNGGTFGVGGYGVVPLNGDRGGGTLSDHAPASSRQRTANVHNQDARNGAPSRALLGAALAGLGISAVALTFHRFGGR